MVLVIFSILSECPHVLIPSTGETKEDVNNVNCRLDMTEILLKAA